MAGCDPETDYLSWCRQIATLKPPQCQFAPDDKKLVVAVLRHDRLQSRNNGAEDFLWINCKTRTTFSKVIEAYQQTNPGITSLVLSFLGRRCHPAEKLKDIALPGSEVLILQVNEEVMSEQKAQRDPSPPQRQASTNASEIVGRSRVRSPLLSTTANMMSTDPSRNDKGPFTKQDEVLQENISPSARSSSTLFASRRSPNTLSVPIKIEDQSTINTNTNNNISLPSFDTLTKTLPSSEQLTERKHPAWLQPLLRPTLGSPPYELPSTRIPNQNVNQPFLRYLDHHYQTSPSVRTLSLQSLVDHVWSLWQSLPEKSQERKFFIGPVESRLKNTDAGNDKSLLKALQDTKPEVPQEPGHSQQEEPTPLLDFKAEFGEIAKPETQASQSAQPTQVTQSDSLIQEIMSGASVEDLETSVARGITWLDAIKAILEIHQDTSQEAKNWLKGLEQTRSYSTQTKTVIGVVGNTGAGKSSVINALLDEEQLLPTNTMRACTAVVTEIAYNFEEGKKYRAEIEFIDEKSWQDELGILFYDLVNSNGEVVKESSTADSDAGIAYAKIKAVYPKKTKEDIAHSSIPNLIKEVSHILGKTTKVQDDDSLVFYKRLQKYIDSQEKVTANATAAERKGPREMEFWPLIKVVRIYCKSDALATGATIVDLPGVHDANAARAAVAEGYMKQCSGLWIVAPIIRAVDDKAAKNLLGQQFKRQLKMDGGFSMVSFICSKTDDISLMEATASLGLAEVNGPMWTEADRQSNLQKQLKSDITKYSDAREALSETMEAVEAQVEEWEALEDHYEEDGEPLYAPVSHKRKAKRRTSSNTRKQKRRRRGSDDDTSDAGSDSEFEDPDDEENDEDEVSVRKRLTLDEITSQISSFKLQVKSARKERAELNNRIKECKTKVQDSVRAQREIEASIAEKCIAGRNEYSKEAIRQDFAAGVRELDQEKAQDEDEANFDPEEELRDYDEVARSLPVFCVSSRGYQQLSGRLTKDTKVAGFTELDQTEMPALQKHCKQLTVASRTAACKKFLVAISRLANSLSMWAVADSTNKHLSAQQKENEKKFLSASLGVLENELEKLVNTTYDELKGDMQDNIFDKFDTACQVAEDKAVDTGAGWGFRPDPTVAGGGGYLWQTYKAVCRRDGAYTNASRGPIDFNAQLAEPMMVHILSSWERLFGRRIPHVLQALKRNLSQLVKTFHSDVSERAQLSDIGTAALPVLEQQLANYEHKFEEIATTTKMNIDQAQRNTNREFIPSIKENMVPGYTTCVAEIGTGQFMRMKGHMHNHVSSVCYTMFRTCCRGVEASLKKVLDQIKGDLRDASDEIFESIERDYRFAFSGADLRPGETMPRWQRSMRKAVSNLTKQLKDYLKSDTPPEMMEDNTLDDEAAAMQLESGFGGDGPADVKPVFAVAAMLNADTNSREEEEKQDGEESDWSEYERHEYGWEPWHDLEERDPDDEDEDEDEEE